VSPNWRTNEREQWTHDDERRITRPDSGRAVAQALSYTL
jgi:hypothetical protein